MHCNRNLVQGVGLVQGYSITIYIEYRMIKSKNYHNCVYDDNGDITQVEKVKTLSGKLMSMSITFC